MLGVSLFRVKNRKLLLYNNTANRFGLKVVVKVCFCRNAGAELVFEQQL